MKRNIEKNQLPPIFPKAFKIWKYKKTNDNLQKKEHCAYVVC